MAAHLLAIVVPLLVTAACLEGVLHLVDMLRFEVGLGYLEAGPPNLEVGSLSAEDATVRLEVGLA